MTRLRLTCLSLLLTFTQFTRADGGSYADAPWVRMGGIPGVNGVVRALAADEATGKLYLGGDFAGDGTWSPLHVGCWDGDKWAPIGGGINGPVHALAVADGQVYAGGLFTQAGGVPVSNIARWDGTSWHPVGGGVNGRVNALLVDGSDLYVGGDFNASSGTTLNHVARWDGAAWHSLGAAPGLNGPVHALAKDASGLHAGGTFTVGVASNYARWDGITWSAVGVGFNGTVRALAFHQGLLHAAGDFTQAGGAAVGRVARWNGTDFGPVFPGDTGMDAPVNALISFGGELIAGGSFTGAGGVGAYRIARSDGSSWSVLVQNDMDMSAFGNEGIMALAVLAGKLRVGGDVELFENLGGTTGVLTWSGLVWQGFLGDGTDDVTLAAVEYAGDLYVGGDFWMAGGAAAPYLARWDGSTWSRVGLGVAGGKVECLTVADGQLYAGGEFTQAGSQPAGRIARWDGMTWHPLGTGVNGSVHAITVHEGQVYAAGNFTSAGGQPANHIARWDGSAWHALGSGMDGEVYSLAFYNGELYAGGDFATAGGVTAPYLAHWDGSAWNRVGTLADELASSVATLAVHEGELYVGGDFNIEGSFVARWNGSAWSIPGNGLDDTVQVLLVDGGMLYAAGMFDTHLPEGVARGLARWDGTSWSPVSSGVPVFIQGIYSLVRVGQRLYVGGEWMGNGFDFEEFLAYVELPFASTPELAVSGNGMDISNGDDSPDVTDYTDFGSALAGGSAVARTFTVSNTGTAALNLTGTPHVALSGSAAFSVSSQPVSASVAANGGTQTFEMTFAPATPGPHSAVVSIASDDADENPFTFTVAGEGFSVLPSQKVTAAAGEHAFMVGVAGDWTWSQSPGSTWITSNEAGNQSGVQNFTFSVAANTVPGTRIAGITVTNGTETQTHLVIQAGAAWSGGTVVAWGDPAVLDYLPPGLTDVIAISSSPNSSGAAALRADGSVVSLGGGGYFEGPPGLTNVATLSVGDLHTLALKTDGTVTTWMHDRWRPLGEREVPEGLSEVVAIAAGIGHSLALKADGTVVAWGDNGEGQADVPAGLNGVVAIAAGGNLSAALKADGTVAWWGLSSGPTAEADVVAIAAGYNLIHTVDSSGTAYGSLGFVNDVTSLAAGGGHELFIQRDGTVVALGQNHQGVTDVPTGLGRAVAVAAGLDVSVALIDGTPQIEVSGNGQVIANGDDTPSPTDHTDFGSSSGTRTFTVKNDGSAALMMTNGNIPSEFITLSGSEAFTVSEQPASATVAAGGGTQTFEIRFAPTHQGPHTATVMIASNASEILHTFQVSGEILDAGEIAFLSPIHAINDGTAFDVLLERTGGTAPVSVTLTTSDGTASTVPPFAAALAGTDYEALSTIVDFAEGETMKVVPITLLPRTGTLPNRRFTVTLSAPTGGATLGAIASAEIRLLASDTRVPTLTVRFPTATATLVTQVAPIVVHGTAGDALGLDRVEMDYGGSTYLAILGAASKPTSVPWSFEFTPPGDGPVSLTIRAYDLSGNVTTLTRSFDFIRRYPLTVTRQVPGGLGSPEEAGAVRMTSNKGDFSALLPAKGAATQTGTVVPLAQVTLTPKAAAGYAFSHWQGLPAGHTLAGSVASFQMPAEDVTGITAVFVTNPYLGLGVRPVFYGLIAPTESTSHSNASHGSLTTTLVTGSGSLSGKIFLNGQATAFVGVAMGNGSVWFRAPDKSLHTALALPGGAQMTGSFDAGTFLVEITGGDTLEGTALPAAYSKTQLVPAGLLNSVTQGFYTIALPAKAQTPAKALADYPQGSGYGSLTLKDNGTLRFAGVLADGSKYTAASALVAGDEAPVHAQLLTPGTTTAEKGGSLLGTLVFDTSQDDSDVAGMDLRWFRPAVTEQSGTTATALATQVYTAGWPEGLVLDLIGAKYDKAATAQTTLGFGAGNAGLLSLAEGKLVAEVEVNNFTVSGNTAVKTPSTDKSYTLSFTQSTGLMKGTFTPNWESPAAKLPGFTGVLLSKGANQGGWGFFLSNRAGDSDPESGTVLLEEYPFDPVPGFSVIPGGTFQMGDSLDDDLMESQPVHPVHVSTFYLQSTEVTMAEWEEVRAWGLLNGYPDLLSGEGKAADHPVSWVNWYDVVKWCNARSEMQGLTPCYHTDTKLQNVYRTGEVNVTHAMVRWAANGHRLPTEAEWEKGARGGLEGKRFPWGDILSHNEANFWNSIYAPYVTGTTGRHPVYATGGAPSTNPVTAFPANDYGLHDMAGNMMEWCWDWFALDYYAVSPASNPPGPTNGVAKVIRGGCWGSEAGTLRCAWRAILGIGNTPTHRQDFIGFRTARSR